MEVTAEGVAGSIPARSFPTNFKIHKEKDMTTKSNPKTETIIDGIHEALQDEIDSTRHRSFHGEISLTLEITQGMIQSANIQRKTQMFFAPPLEEK